MLNSLQKKLYFGAKPIARYESITKDGQNPFLQAKKHNVVVYKLQEEDLNFLKQLKAKNKRFNLTKPKSNAIDDKDLKDLVDGAITDSMAWLSLKARLGLNSPTNVYLATCDNLPAGILLGGMPKLTQNTQITYSDRGRPDESEIDWLASWRSKDGKKSSAVAPALCREFFSDCIRSKGINTIYVRSKTPEQSSAMSFYSKIGFKPISSTTTIPLEAKDRPVQITDIFDDWELATYPVCPMLVYKNDLSDKIKSIDKKFHRKAINTDKKVILSA